MRKEGWGLSTLKPSKGEGISPSIDDQKKRLDMMVLIQNAKKFKFLDKFDAVWLGPYFIREASPNNSLQLETLNGDCSPTHTSDS